MVVARELSKKCCKRMIFDILILPIYQLSISAKKELPQQALCFNIPKRCI